MTSHHCDNLHVLITFQGQDASCKDRLSHDGRILFSAKLKPSGNSKLAIVTHLIG